MKISLKGENNNHYHLFLAAYKFSPNVRMTHDIPDVVKFFNTTPYSTLSG
jgi:hypothetical protein